MSQRERAIEVRRREANGEWSTTVARAGEHAALSSVDCVIDVDAFYEGAADPKA